MLTKASVNIPSKKYFHSTHHSMCSYYQLLGAISMRAVNLCTNKILQFLTEGAS